MNLWLGANEAEPRNVHVGATPAVAQMGRGNPRGCPKGGTSKPGPYEKRMVSLWKYI
jgi:hypothetical protein